MNAISTLAEALASTGDDLAAMADWQKTLGGHQVWSSGQVEVRGDEVTMTTTRQR